MGQERQGSEYPALLTIIFSPGRNWPTLQHPISEGVPGSQKKFLFEFFDSPPFPDADHDNLDGLARIIVDLRHLAFLLFRGSSLIRNSQLVALACCTRARNKQSQ